MESENVLRSRSYRLCGFFVVVVKARCEDLHGDCAGLDQLVGAQCSLEGRGTDAHVRVEETELRLWPLESAVSQSLEVAHGREGKLFDAESDPAGVGSGGKRKRASGNGNGEGLLHQMLALLGKNNSRVEGKVLAVSHKGDDTRVVALLDLYLPPSAWMGTGFWKSGAPIAAALSHLSCDWDHRRMLLMKLKSSEEIATSDEVWEHRGCHVLGCKVHRGISESNKSRFDLHSLFKSLPSYKSEGGPEDLKLLRDEHVTEEQTGIWDVPDEIITSIFSRLLPKDLPNVAAVSRYTRMMAVPIMPCMRLRLFPHQQAAVRWMLQRENRPGMLAHPLYKRLETEDGFPFYLDTVTGEISPEAPPEVEDCRGGLFCDEPGLGKTVTALSLILKTQGASADPPVGTRVSWIPRGPGEKMGYYEVKSGSSVLGGSALKRSMLLKARKNQEGAWESDRVKTPDMFAKDPVTPASLPVLEAESVQRSTLGLSNGRSMQDSSMSVSQSTRQSRRLSCPLPDKTSPGSLGGSIRVKRKLGESFEKASAVTFSDSKKTRKGRHSSGSVLRPPITAEEATPASTSNGSLDGEEDDESTDWAYEEDNWVQCDSCFKWRKLPRGATCAKDDVAWFCNLNPDSLHQKCTVPQEADPNASVKSLGGFYKHGTNPGQPQNVAYFANVLKANAHLYDEGAKRPVTWLANLTSDQQEKLAKVGLALPREFRREAFTAESSSCNKLFLQFGLETKRTANKGTLKWHYPKGLDGLFFDTLALKEAARKPRDDATRLYLSRATLIVVPQSLVEHWRYQITKHTTPGQLRVYVWTDHKTPAAAHDLAWDYDIVITTFSRLSSEWTSREKSVLMRIHWLRIMLDEGHTLGASLNLTNKLQMAISLHASRRWILTGTPTPNTPSSQAACLRPMMEFLHEGIFSKQQKLWDNAILRPFQDGCEEGRARLVQLLHRTMISSRKADLCTIPPCIRKVTLVNFTVAHAATYNELVVTVQRNILLADWRDPSHVESLLNPKQWKFRSTTLRNTRLSCCVAGHIKVGMSGEDVYETMDLLVSDYGVVRASEKFYKIENALIHGDNCDRCQEWCRLPIITPCCHLLCLSCVAMDCEKCTMTGCGHPYKMQSPAELARPENPTPKWPVPQDLIELQPSYAQDDWDPDWHATSSSKVAYLVTQLKAIQENNLMMQFNSADALLEKPEFDRGFKLTTWQTYSHNMSCSLPYKAIVFSQFLEHIHVIESQLKAAGIQFVGMYSPMHSTNKMKSLVTFQNDPGCTVLVMDASASLGLDLSFVTHVYLMEPIWDRSVEEQVVSRAHRMGAIRPVLVETLAMRGTIEQQILEFLQDPTSKGICDSSGRGNYMLENSCLTNLNFVRTAAVTA